MNVSNLKTIFGGCITATNIIRDQIEDRNDVAVWYLSAGEVPVTPAAIVDEVQDAWEADPDSHVLPAEIAALKWVADREGIPLRDQWTQALAAANPGIPREAVEAWLYEEVPLSAAVAIPIISQDVYYGLWRHETLGDALRAICDDLRNEFDAAYFPADADRQERAAEEILEVYKRRG